LWLLHDKTQKSTTLNPCRYLEGKACTVRSALDVDRAFASACSLLTAELQGHVLEESEGGAHGRCVAPPPASPSPPSAASAEASSSHSSRGKGTLPSAKGPVPSTRTIRESERRPTVGQVTVIQPTGLLVPQNPVGFIDLLEPVFCSHVIRISVRVPLKGALPESPLDFLCFCLRADVQHLVVVLSSVSRFHAR